MILDGTLDASVQAAAAALQRGELLGLPTERYGFSNDARGRMGPPGFDAAAVPLDADHSITIRLR